MNVWSPSAFELETERPFEPVRPGDYFHSERDLFCVERCDDGRALIEDCRTGELIDIEIRHLAALARVRRAA